MLKEITQALVALALPPVCCHCGREPDGDRDALCADCLRVLPILPGTSCGRCAMPDCVICPGAGRPWRRAIAACSYEGAARDLVTTLKAAPGRIAADAMAEPMASRLGRGELSGFALVPVPPRRGRLDGGGGDHARALADAFGRRTARPVVCALRWRDDRGRQATADRAARLAGTSEAIEAVGPVPPRALLIDDVHTTGSTLAAASEAILSAGAVEVICVTFARTLRVRAPAGAW